MAVPSKPCRVPGCQSAYDRPITGSHHQPEEEAGRRLPVTSCYVAFNREGPDSELQELGCPPDSWFVSKRAGAHTHTFRLLTWRTVAETENGSPICAYPRSFLMGTIQGGASHAGRTTLDFFPQALKVSLHRCDEREPGHSTRRLGAPRHDRSSSPLQSAWDGRSRETMHYRGLIQSSSGNGLLAGQSWIRSSSSFIRSLLWTSQCRADEHCQAKAVTTPLAW